MKPIAIYGAGGLGVEVLGLIHSLPEWSPIGFFDDGLELGCCVHNLRNLGGIAELRGLTEPTDLVIAVGNPKVKKQLVEKLKGIANVRFPVLVHPQSILMDTGTIQLGEGSIVCAGAILTTHISLGQHVLVNLNTTIGHHGVVGDFSSIMPGSNIAGNVTLGAGVMIGSGANIRNGVSIGATSVVGMGAVVLNDVPPSMTVIGVPARELKSS